MVHPQALVEPMSHSGQIRKNEKRTERNFRTVTSCCLENFILNFFFIGNQFCSFKTRLSVFKSNCAVVLEKSRVF
jgi:hypothetical protein